MSAELTDLEKWAARHAGLTYEQYTAAKAQPETAEQTDARTASEARLIIAAITGGGRTLSIEDRRELRAAYAGRNTIADQYMQAHPLPEQESETTA